MTPEDAKRWIKRLQRSSSKKTCSILCEDTTPTYKSAMCCLGHLAHLNGDMVAKGELRTFNQVYPRSSYLTNGLLSKYGMSDEEQEELSRLNDVSRDFKNVIARIRELYIDKPTTVA